MTLNGKQILLIVSGGIAARPPVAFQFQVRVSGRSGWLVRRVSGSCLAPAAVAGIAVEHFGSGPGSCRR